MKRVAIVGASGFVGSTLVESLIEREGIEVVPIIHSSGNAWRLARRGLPLRIVNLLEQRQLADTLAGCTHVVNCSRGDDDVMLKGLRNLLDASLTLKVKGFVHLSSVAVYGDPPPAQAVSESAPTLPLPGTYGATKLKQDQLVQTAARQGLPSIILCPPNIGGPYSIYMIQLLSTLRSGRFALLDDGSEPCNLVDVANLAYAIELALDHPSREAPRLFITDDDPVTWKDVIDHLTPLLESQPAQQSIGRDELLALSAAAPAPPRSLLRSLKHLVSSDVRAALRKDPLLSSFDGVLRRLAAKLGGPLEDRLRLYIEGPRKVEKISFQRKIDARLCAQQLRGVRHSCDRAKSLLGYRPQRSFKSSMAAFQSWYRLHTGMESRDEWALLRHLYS